jgi:hypothetical protein
MNPYLLAYLIGAAITLWVFAVGQITTARDERAPLDLKHGLVLLVLLALWFVTLPLAIHRSITAYHKLRA